MNVVKYIIRMKSFCTITMSKRPLKFRLIKSQVDDFPNFQNFVISLISNTITNRLVKFSCERILNTEADIMNLFKL